MAARIRRDRSSAASSADIVEDKPFLAAADGDDFRERGSEASVMEHLDDYNLTLVIIGDALDETRFLSDTISPKVAARLPQSIS